MYGNYDAKGKIPTVDLYLGVNRWDTVAVPDASSTLTKEIMHISPSEDTMTPPWRFWSFCSELSLFLSVSDKVFVKWVSRQCNTAAHTLAKWSLSYNFLVLLILEIAVLVSLPSFWKSPGGRCSSVSPFFNLVSGSSKKKKYLSCKHGQWDTFHISVRAKT